MKQFNRIALAAILLIGSIACTKKTLNPETANSNAVQIFQQHDKKTRSVEFANLTALERKQYWITSTNTFIANHPNLTVEQTAVITQFQNFMNNVSFEDNCLENRQSEVENLVNLSRSEFGDNDTYILMYDPSYDPLKPFVNPSPNSPPCECNVGSMFTCAWAITQGNDCKASKCKVFGSGCGFLFLSSCNGKCALL